MTKTGVLFVCTGNICRSPTAEGVFLDRLRAEGIEGQVFAASAGTHDYHVGEPPDPRAVAMAKRRGVDIGHLRARHLKDSDFDAYDYIVALDRGHLSILNGYGAGRRGRAVLLMSFDPGGARDVPDPYYKGEEAFAEAYDLIDAGVTGLVRHIRERGTNGR